jgi:uncharacterized protein
MPRGILKNIFVYPVKSMGGIEMPLAQVEPRGLRWDRRWMLVTPDGQAITQREFPKLARVRVLVDDERLILRLPSGENLEVAEEPEEDTPMRVTLWGTTCDAQNASTEAGSVLSRYLGAPCRLVYMPESSRRGVDPQHARNGDLVGFADAYPFMMLGEESVADLNTRLPSPLPMNRFRPNFVISGFGPYGEDTFGPVRVGESDFVGARNCHRCVVMTVSQERGEFDGKEPLHTLSTYRKTDNQVAFGRYLLGPGKGVVRAGDVVEAV